MVEFLKALCKYLQTCILPCPGCLRVFCSDPKFSEFDWKGSAWNLLSHCALPVSQALCRQKRWRLFIPVYCLALWSSSVIYSNHLAVLCSEPDCSSSALCSCFAVLSETAKKITVEIAGDLFSAPVYCEDRLLGGVLETEMIAWEFYRQLSFMFSSQLFQCQHLCF